jgi:cytochrome b561
MNTETSPGVVAATRIAAGDDRTRYDTLSILLHWATTVLVVTQFALAELWDFAAKPTKHLMITAHMSFGILLTIVIVVRIAWRLTPGHKVRQAAVGWVEAASKGVHYLLYALLATEAVLGFVLRWSGNEAMSFFGILIPPPFPAFSKPAHHLVGDVHNWIAWTIIILAVGHASAALFHHYVLRDNLLWRMLPGQHAERQEAQTPTR